jgi:hypothetical protein
MIQFAWMSAEDEALAEQAFKIALEADAEQFQSSAAH